MIIYPAIDLRAGKVVRLVEGNPNQQTIFSDDPLAIAQEWIAQGTQWIHMVNLDGAFAEAGAAANQQILQAVAALGVKVQFGGGMRTPADVEQAFEHGAARVVLGTIAVEQTQVIPELLTQWGAEKLCVALDARDGKIATHGWQRKTELKPVEFGRQIAEMGVIHALYTDIRRDGHLSGGNLHDTITLGRETGLKVIASGGITRMDEIVQLARSHTVAGAIIGRALYEKQLTLKEAFLAASLGGQS